MANSTSNLDTISSGQSAKEVTANALFDAVSAASTYGRRASTSTALTWGYYGGNVTKTDNALVQIANGTLTLTASTTNYIVAAKATGVVSVSTATTNWNNATDYWRLYSVVTGVSTVTSYTDARELGKFTLGVVGGGDVTLTGTQTLTNKTLTSVKETLTAPTISAGTLTLDLSASSVFNVALNAAITTLTISNPASTGTAHGFTLVFTADGTLRAVTWGAAIKWPGGTAPTLTSTNGKRDVFSFMTFDGGTTWMAFNGGQNL